MREDERASEQERKRETGRKREVENKVPVRVRMRRRRRGGEETWKDGRGRTLWIRGENAYAPWWYGSAERARVQYLAR